MACLFTPAALADLDDIWTYTLDRWGETQAKHYFREIAAACTEVANGERPSRPIDDIRPGYRKVLINAHVAYFRETAGGDTEIVRILHQRMDIERHLG